MKFFNGRVNIDGLRTQMLAAWRSKAQLRRAQVDWLVVQIAELNYKNKECTLAVSNCAGFGNLIHLKPQRVVLCHNWQLTCERHLCKDHIIRDRKESTLHVAGHCPSISRECILGSQRSCEADLILLEF